MRKRIIAFVLAIALTVSLLPMHAAADGGLKWVQAEPTRDQGAWDKIVKYADEHNFNTVESTVITEVWDNSIGHIAKSAAKEYLDSAKVEHANQLRKQLAMRKEYNLIVNEMKTSKDANRIFSLVPVKDSMWTSIEGQSKMVDGVRTKIKVVRKLSGVTSFLGKGLGVLGLVNDIESYNTVKHKKHAYLDFLTRTVRGVNMGLTAADIAGNKLATVPSLVTGLAKDILESDTFIGFTESKYVSWIYIPADFMTERMNEAMQGVGTAFWFVWDGTGDLISNAWEGTKGAAADLYDYLMFDRCNVDNAGVYKPNIYIYPTETTPITVTFRYPGGLTKTIPDYSGNWSVVADPNGKLRDGENDWDFLFYECITDVSDVQFEEGYIITDENRYAQLSQLIASYGFNEQETKDFADFWDDKLEKGVRYAAYPMLTEIVDVLMPVEITPAPDRIGRLWFAFQEDGVPEKEACPVVFDRDGYTVLEWGGLFIR